MTSVTTAAWRTAASCTSPDVDPQVFFAGAGTPDEFEARRQCAGCPVSCMCLSTALARDERHGVWGGVSAGSARWNSLRQLISTTPERNTA